MRNLLFIFILSTLTPLINGCAPRLKTPLNVQRTSAIFSAPKNKVWPLLVAEVGLNYPVKIIDKDSGLLTTDIGNMPVGFGNSGMERYVFPPRVSIISTWRGLRMYMRIVVIEPEPNKTMVKIKTHYEAYENNMIKGWLDARSNGAVENQILTNIEQNIPSIHHNTSIEKSTLNSNFNKKNSEIETKLKELKKLKAMKTLNLISEAEYKDKVDLLKK